MVDELQELCEAKDRRILDLQKHAKNQEAMILKMKLAREKYDDAILKKVEKLQKSNRRYEKTMKALVKDLANRNILVQLDDGRVLDPDAEDLERS